jgi:hypothetical protein
MIFVFKFYFFGVAPSAGFLYDDAAAAAGYDNSFLYLMIFATFIFDCYYLSLMTAPLSKNYL